MNFEAALTRTQNFMPGPYLSGFVGMNGMKGHRNLQGISCSSEVSEKSQTYLFWLSKENFSKTLIGANWSTPGPRLILFGLSHLMDFRILMRESVPNIS